MKLYIIIHYIVFISLILISLVLTPIIEAKNIENNQINNLNIIAQNINCGFEQREANTFEECINLTGGDHSTILNQSMIPTGNDLWQNETWVAIYRGFIGFNTSLIDFSKEIISAKLYIKTYTPAYGNVELIEEVVNIYNRPASENVFNWSNMYNNYSYEGELLNIINIENDAWYSINLSTNIFGLGNFSNEYGEGVDTVLYIMTPLEFIEPFIQTFLQTVLFDTSEMPYLVIEYDESEPEYNNFEINPEPEYSNEIYNFTIEITDNGTIEDVYINISGIGNFSMKSGDNVIWYHESLINQSGNISIIIWITDQTGNSNYFEYSFILIVEENWNMLLIYLVTAIFPLIILLIILKKLIKILKKYLGV
jgi:hypothetical protein